jgi:hypothetical protein
MPVAGLLPFRTLVFICYVELLKSPVIEFGLVRSTALPASGGVVSAPVIIAGLFGVMVIGVVMIIAGRRQARRDLSA